MKLTQNQQDKLLSIVVALCLIFIGSVAGWSARVLTTADKAKIAKFERDLAQRDYYEMNTEKIKREVMGIKPLLPGGYTTERR